MIEPYDTKSEYRDNPIQPIGKKEHYRRAWTLVDMILKPEKCKIHDEWMKPYTTFDRDYTHQTIERVCEVCIAEKTKTH